MAHNYEGTPILKDIHLKKEGAHLLLLNPTTEITQNLVKIKSKGRTLIWKAKIAGSDSLFFDIRAVGNEISAITLDGEGYSINGLTGEAIKKTAPFKVS